MEDVFLIRVARASVAFPWFAALSILLAGFLFLQEMPWSLVFGLFALGLSQLLRAGAVLQRAHAGCLLRPPTLRSLIAALLAVAATAASTSLLADGFLSESNGKDDRIVSCVLIGIVSLLRLMERGVLEWSPFPRERWHRRLKARIVAILLHAAISVVVCRVVAAFCSYSPIFSSDAWAWWKAAMTVLLIGNAHIEALHDCVSMGAVASSELPRTGELADALSQPLATSGAGLGRWLATATLAQAVAYGQRRSFTERRAWSASTSPPLAAELFGRACIASVARPVPSPLRLASRFGFGGGYGPAASLHGETGPGLWSRNWAAQGGQPSANSSSGATLFSVYLSSALEVIREISVRSQCLVAAAGRQGLGGAKTGIPLTLMHPAHVAELSARLVELMPLARLAAAGLAGWVSLSRDLDEGGVVQREEALRKSVYELCGVLRALENVWGLRGLLRLSGADVLAVQGMQEEARHGLEQVLITFQDAGLREVALPPLYRQLVTSLCQ